VFRDARKRQCKHLIVSLHDTCEIGKRRGLKPQGSYGWYDRKSARLTRTAGTFCKGRPSHDVNALHVSNSRTTRTCSGCLKKPFSMLIRAESSIDPVLPSGFSEAGPSFTRGKLWQLPGAQKLPRLTLFQWAAFSIAIAPRPKPTVPRTFDCSDQAGTETRGTLEESELPSQVWTARSHEPVSLPRVDHFPVKFGRRLTHRTISSHSAWPQSRTQVFQTNPQVSSHEL
jgi:hypothetical protein